MKLYRKLFSKKEDYKNGAETERQEKDRKKVVKALAGSSALLGAEFGAIGADLKASSKVGDKVAHAKSRQIVRSMKAARAVEYTRNKVKPQDKAAYNELLIKVANKLKNGEEAVGRFEKRANKIAKKAVGKGALKGAAIGTGVGVGLGYLANKSIKKRNEEVNKARRNKKKKD